MFKKKYFVEFEYELVDGTQEKGSCKVSKFFGVGIDEIKEVIKDNIERFTELEVKKLSIKSLTKL